MSKDKAWDNMIMDFHAPRKKIRQDTGMENLQAELYSLYIGKTD